MFLRRTQKVPTSNAGERFVTTYRSAFNKDNVLGLVESGKYDLYADIQSHKDSVDIEAIIARANAGDLSVLNRRTPLYFDATEFPQTYAEMYQKIIDATAYFEQLPLEIRDKFGHSPETFFASIGTDLWSDAMSEYLNAETPVVATEGGAEIEQKSEQ